MFKFKFIKFIYSHHCYTRLSKRKLLLISNKLKKKKREWWHNIDSPQRENRRLFNGCDVIRLPNNQYTNYISMIPV